MENEIRSIIEEINRHSHSVADETIDDVLAMGRGLVRLFGYRDRKRNIDIPGLLKLKKRQYPELGLKPGYGWTRRLMKLAMDDKIADPQYRHVLPRGRNNLEQCSRMTLARFEQGIKPDPNQRGEIVIHPEAKLYDLRDYRKQGKEIKPPKQRQLVIVLIPRVPEGFDEWGGDFEDIRHAAHREGCDFAMAEVVSKTYKETIFEEDSTQETLWTLSLHKIQKASKRDMSSYYTRD
jgi:hypothetical protein